VPIAWRVGGTGRIDIEFSDPYSIAESEKVMNDIYAAPGLRRPFRFLVDVRKSAAPDAEFVVSAITFWQLHVSDMWGAKIAVLTANDAQVGMARVSERSAESRGLPFTVGVYRAAESDEAEQWLEQAG
jgi:hypothetical protein